MEFNVSGLLRDPVGATRRYDLEREAPIHAGRVVLTRTPDGVLVAADIDVVIDTSCSRCLAPFGYPLRIHFDEIFVQQVDLLGGRLATPDDPDTFLISTQHTIDITEAVRQYSEAAAAMQPLCREECPGICPVCGQDLSIAVCSCDRTPVDPRWEALAALRRN